MWRGGRWSWLGLAACGDDRVPIEPGPGGCDPTEALGIARAATEAYGDPAVALAEGYVPQGACDEDDRGAAMGLHYVRIAASFNQELDVAAPDVLLYLPDAGGDRLVGIEYLRPALLDGEPVFAETADEDAFDGPPPELFCRPFDGPMAGHVEGQPWHHDLHVWLYAENPDGRFAPYNPALACP